VPLLLPAATLHLHATCTPAAGGPCKDYSGQAIALSASDAANGTAMFDNKFDYARFR